MLAVTAYLVVTQHLCHTILTDEVSRNIVIQHLCNTILTDAFSLACHATLEAYHPVLTVILTFA